MPIALTSRTVLFTRWLAIIGVLSLPLWSHSLWQTTQHWQDTRNNRDACARFMHAQPGWQLASVLQAQIEALEPEARGAFIDELDLAKAQLEAQAQATPAQTVRLHALPLHPDAHWWRGQQQLIGSRITITSRAEISVPGVNALYVDVPWRGGAYVSVNLSTPCGTYHQDVSLFLRTDHEGVIRIKTFKGTQVISTQEVPITGP